MRHRSPILFFSIILLGLIPSSYVPADEAKPSAGGFEIRRPAAASGPLDNPLKGYCLYTNAGKIHRPYSMVFQYVSWRELESIEGKYTFEDWEKRDWNHPRAKDKHLVLRVYVDYPSKPSGLPEWLRAKGVKESSYQEYGGGKSPDYNHPKMVEAMERFIAALGKRYNTHPRVAFIQLGFLGFWGEWHTYPRAELFASEATQHRILKAYQKAFPDKQLMARYADGVLAKYKGIGFHDDMFPEDTDNGEDWSFLARMRRGGHADGWKQNVVGGEMVPHAAQKWLGNQWAHTQEMISRSHFSWIGPYGPALDENVSLNLQARSDQLVRKMGYQFRLTEVRHSKRVALGKGCVVLVRGVNEGVAPFYYRWPVKLAWLDTKGNLVSEIKLQDDIRKWLPGKFQFGTVLSVPEQTGIYQLGVGVIDPWKKKPAIRFANELTLQSGWSILGQVEVGSN